MNPMILQGIGIVLSTIETLLPLLLGANNAAKTTQIENIIQLLEKWLPMIGDEVSVLYTGIKNIIAALTADPSTTADQYNRLQQLDAKTDEAFETAAADVDPDAPVATN